MPANSSSFFSVFPFSVSDYFEMFDKIAPEMLYYQDAPDNEKQKITDRIKEYYFKEHGNEDISTLIQVSIEWFATFIYKILRYISAYYR